MSKKTLILSQEQLDEICGGDSSYLDGLDGNDDMKNKYSLEISADGGVDNGYADPTTTDDYASDITNDWMRGGANMHGYRAATIREMTKKEWEKEFLSEDNSMLQNANFGAGNGDKGKSYTNTTTTLSRLKKAEEKAVTGATPYEKQKAARTVQTMKKNWGNIDAAKAQYNAAKNNTQSIISSRPEGQRKKGNGKANEPKNGIFTS